MTVRVEVVEDAIGRHFHECRHAHKTNEQWFACEARAVVAALALAAAEDPDHHREAEQWLARAVEQWELGDEHDTKTAIAATAAASIGHLHAQLAQLDATTARTPTTTEQEGTHDARA